MHTVTQTHTPVAAPLGWVSSLGQVLCCETPAHEFLSSLRSHLPACTETGRATCLTWCNICPSCLLLKITSDHL